MASPGIPVLDFDWPAPPSVRALCSTRDGGVSAGPYRSLNLGDHVGDDPACVAANRQAFAQRIGARPVFMRQVHGSHVVHLAQDVADGVEADGCIASVRGIACTIMVADCMPVLFAKVDGSAVGAAHAGWRGLAGGEDGGVIEAVVRALGRVTGDVQHAPDSLIAWLGPCIGPAAFEVGDEVKAEFERHDASAARHFRGLREGKWLADLPALARDRLAALGITRVYGNDGSAEWCTVTNASRFFSHRRDRVSGRFAAAIWLA